MGQDNNLRGRGRGRLRGRGRGRGRLAGVVTNQIVDIVPKYPVHNQRRTLVDHLPNTTPRATSNRGQHHQTTSSSSYKRINSTVSTRSTPANRRATTTDDSSGGNDQFVIISITGGRGDARGEIGMAAMDAQYPHMVLCQTSDNNSYINTLTTINMFQPVEILLPVTMGSKDQNPESLYNAIKSKFNNIPITEIARMHYNATTGFERIKTHCADEFSSVKLVINSKYYALAAASALFKYIESIQHLVYEPKSLRINYQSAENVTMIDIESAKSLELVNCNGANKKYSLFSSLDRCSTPMGRRLLRASILQPSCNINVIQTRQACIEELLSNRSLHLILQPVIRRLSGGNRLLGLAMKTSQADTIQCAERNLNYILLLKNTIDIIPELQGALKTSKSPFFKRVLSTISDERFNDMKNEIDKIIQPDAKALKGCTSANMQRCFAIKAKINDMLDIARQAYCELIDDMVKMVEKYSENYKLSLSLGFTNSLGYHVQLEIPKGKTFDLKSLPDEFIHAHRKNKIIFMTTEELVIYGQHCKDARDEIHLMSNAILDELLANLRKHIGCLFQLNDDVAEVDLIMSLASISSIADYVQPTFGESLNVKNSRHPVMDILGFESPTPNDIVASIAYNFHTISGPNMSGKSVYLKQVVLLHIMAQIGCRVPATKAQFRISDRIFCRLSARDDFEFNASTFTMEIKEAHYILQSLTNKSVVVLDELCRSTTVEEGSSIAWEISRLLLLSPAFTFSATHFTFLWKLADVYPNVTNHHLEAIPRDTDRPEEARLVYTHKLKKGVVVIEHYGMILARSTCLPKKILDDAQMYIDKIKETMEINKTIRYQIDYRVKMNYDALASVYEKIEEKNIKDDELLTLLNGIDLLTCNDSEETDINNLSDTENDVPNKQKSNLTYCGQTKDGKLIVNDDETSYCDCDDNISVKSQNYLSSNRVTLQKSPSKRPSSVSRVLEPRAKVPKLSQPNLPLTQQKKQSTKRTGDPNYLPFYQRDNVTSSNSSMTPKRPAFNFKNILTDKDSPLYIPTSSRTPQNKLFIKPKNTTVPRSVKSTSSKNQFTIPEFWQEFRKENESMKNKISHDDNDDDYEDNLKSKKTVMTPALAAATLGIPKFQVPSRNNDELPEEYRHMKYLLKNIDYDQASTSRDDFVKSRDQLFTSEIVKRSELILSEVTKPKTPLTTKTFVKNSTPAGQSSFVKKSPASRTSVGKKSTTSRSINLLSEIQKEFKLDKLVTNNNMKKKQSSTSQESPAMLTKSELHAMTGYNINSPSCSHDRKNVNLLPGMTDSDEEYEKFVISQTSSMENEMAQITARKKEAAVFRLIEGSQFNEEDFLASQPSIDDTVLVTDSDRN
ncbi:mutS protein homolog 4-like [Aphidius gifuensis]|uniref:mutS protein homolog 4-like n=1 Tax=Aphidius gifuensis TaxID=684658 RepID=UPI001CDD2327|nr:mutS protein homolog 4-like [Aphidius gifuensis]